MKPTAFLHHFSAFLASERGSISIEFMVVMPLLLFLTTGGLAFWDAFHSSTKTSRIAYAISDMMSRYEAVDDTDMLYLYNVADKMLDPGLDNRSLRITSICFADDSYHVLWSYTEGGAGSPAPDAMDDTMIPVSVLPTMKPQDSIILTELKAHWEPHFLNVGLGEHIWSTALVTRPRFVKIIPHASLNPSNICPTS